MTVTSAATVGRATESPSLPSRSRTAGCSQFFSPAPTNAADSAIIVLDARRTAEPIGEEESVQRGSIWGAMLAAIAVLLVAGCGGSSSSSTTTNDTASFKSSFTPVVNDFKNVSQGIGTTIQGAASRTDAQIGTEFQQLADRWSAAVNKLNSLTPPANYSSDFNQLKGAATRVESDLKAIVAAAGAHSKTDAQQAATKLVTDIVTAKAASTRITDQLGAK
jgi:gas vesicle protein